MAVNGLTSRWMSFPRFSFVDAFKLSALHVSHTDSTWSTSQKVYITYRFKTSFVYCSPNSANPYTFQHLNNGGSIQNDNTDSKWDFLKEELMPQSQSVALQSKQRDTSGILHRTPKKKQNKRNLKCYHTHIT